MTLAHRDTELRELMDAVDCDPVRLDRTLRRFAVINRLVGGWAAVVRREMLPRLDDARRTGATVRVLDVGCGGGDVLRDVTARLRRHGLRVEGVGIDPDPRAIAVATRIETPGITYRALHAEGLAAAMPEAGETFDLVFSNHVLHHLTDPQRRSFLAATASLASRVVIHSDIRRGRLAYTLYALLAIPFARGTFLRIDGLRSIRRSYRARELAEVVPRGWRVRPGRPFRLFAVLEAGSAPGRSSQRGPGGSGHD